MKTIHLTLPLLTLMISACSSPETNPPQDMNQTDLHVHDMQKADMSDPSDMSDVQPFEACAKQSIKTTPDGHKIIWCEEAFDTPPYVRAPQDTASLIYAGIYPAMGQITARDDKNITLDFDQMRTLFPNESLVFNDQSNVGERYGHAIYAISMKDNKPVSSKPIVVISDRVFLDFFAGKLLQGKIAKRKGATEDGASQYELEATLPIIIQLSAQPEAYADGPSKQFAPHKLTAQVLNATKAMEGAQGDCLEALNIDAQSDPFFGKTTPIDIALGRHTDMHGGFDDVVVVYWPWGDSNMGTVGYIRPADLLRGKVQSLTNYGSFIHGNPVYGPALDFSEVDAMPKPCTP